MRLNRSYIAGKVMGVGIGLALNMTRSTRYTLPQTASISENATLMSTDLPCVTGSSSQSGILPSKEWFSQSPVYRFACGHIKVPPFCFHRPQSHVPHQRRREELVSPTRTRPGRSEQYSIFQLESLAALGSHAGTHVLAHTKNILKAPDGPL